MDAPETIYNQTATHFTLRFFIRPDTTVDGQLSVELAEAFLADLVLPGCDVATLWTRPPGLEAKLATGSYSERRWKAAVKKLRSGELAMISFDARFRDFPNQNIAFTLYLNPSGGADVPVPGVIEVLSTLAYLRHFAGKPERVEALLAIGKKAWNGIPGGPAYGYSSLVMLPPRPVFHALAQKFGPGLGPRALSGPPAERPHPIPVAYIGSEVDGNLELVVCAGRGVKGAFWANYLTASHVEAAGGRQHLEEVLQGMRVEALNGHGLLIVATDNPLPADTEEARERFLLLHRALEPAFLSLAETPPLKRPLLGYFHRP
jgi:Type VI immunity for VRR-NUC